MAAGACFEERARVPGEPIAAGRATEHELGARVLVSVRAIRGHRHSAYRVFLLRTHGGRPIVPGALVLVMVHGFLQPD